MTDIPICPICNAELAEGANECSRCGFKLAGATQQLNLSGGVTQSFSPIARQEASQAAERAAVADPALQVIKGPLTGELFFLNRPTTTLGRDPRCDIFLNDMTVSRHHASITIDPGKVTLADKGSLNGTWVDGKVSDEAQLHEGSIIQIGTFVMMYKEHPER